MRLRRGLYVLILRHTSVLPYGTGCLNAGLLISPNSTIWRIRLSGCQGRPSITSEWVWAGEAPVRGAVKV